MRAPLLILTLLLSLGSPALAQAPEYQVKAAMLANFALFVDWPASAFPAADSPFVVYVLGEDPFGPWLKYELGEHVGSHPVQIRHAEKGEGVQDGHLVFVCRSEQRRLRQELSSLPKSGALIVSDVSPSDDFCRDGGMVALVTDGHKVRFDLNTKAAERAGLRFGSNLKRVARSAACGEGP
jgi:hypothetical protein